MSEPQKPLSELREIGQRNVRGPRAPLLVWAGPSPSLQGCSSGQHTSLFFLLPLALPHSYACLLTLTSASPSACPVLFCTSLLPGDRPTKNSPHCLSRPQLPQEQEMRGAGRPVPCPHPPTLNSEQCPALWPGASANLAISGSSRTPPWSGEGGGLLISAYNHRVAPALWEKKGCNWSRGNPSQFLTNQCQPHCGH